MVNSNRLLEDEDLESKVQDDQESQPGSLTPGGRRDTLRRAFGGYTQNDSSDEEGLGDQRQDIDELASLSRHLGFRVPQDFSEMRSQFPQVQRFLVAFSQGNPGGKHSILGRGQTR